jgi:hypothetical protein
MAKLYSEGDIVTNKNTGEQLILRGGKWEAVTKPKVAAPSEGFEQQRTTGGMAWLEAPLRGMTFGVSDPIIAAGRAASIFDSRPFSEAYKEERAAIEAGKQQLGGWGMAAELAPAVATGVAGARYLPRLFQRNPFVTSPITGATAGGIYGASQAQPGEELGGFQRGAGIGAVMGPAGQALGSLTGRVISPMARGIANIRRPFEQQRAATLLSRDVLEPTGMSVAQTAEEMMKRGPGTMPMEVVGEAGTLAGMKASQASVAARQRIRTAVDKRLAGKWNRLRGDVQRLMGKTGNKFFKTVEDVKKRRAAEASPFYERAYKQSVDEEAIINLAGKWSKYIDEGMPSEGIPAQSGTKIESFIKRKIKALSSPEGVKSGIGDLDNVQDDFWATAQQLRKNNKGRQARILTIMHRDLVDTMEEASPDYAQARALYRSDSAVIDAMNLGRSILKDDAEITEMALSNMSKSEHDAYLTGAAKALRDATATKPPGFFTRNPLIQERLGHAFPDGEALDEFLNLSLTREARISELSSKILHGSNTAEKTMAQREGLGVAVEEFAQGQRTQAIRTIAGQIFPILKGKYPEGVANELASLLTVGNVDQFIKLASMKLDSDDVAAIIRVLGTAGQTGAVIGVQ